MFDRVLHRAAWFAFWFTVAATIGGCTLTIEPVKRYEAPPNYHSYGDNR